ncbi:hypothetical protein ACI6PS_12585 [Flavobacterium sp. PLA-1-15]|uniref:hypothetical protein n=1 Tax=Flavobacterium sp. PLA-1-15 TaxID=3380533 RepID=UPI003B7E944D
MKIKLATLLLLLTFSIGQSQTNSTDPKNKIASVLENYFTLEREAIHLHLNKTTFLTKETIWFKGYVINRKDSKPFFTANVFVLLLDENGKQISEQLVYASNGIFSGKVDLKSNMPSGDYYIQTYTNWMNNFSEDESTISKITIINPAEGAKNYKKTNISSLKIGINPEGGNYIRGIENTIGISLLDCRKNSVDGIEGRLQTPEGEVMRTFKLNKFGYATINVPATEKKLKVVFEHLGNIFEKELPIPAETGIGLTVNNFRDENKTFVNLNTNASTLKTFNKKKLYLVISKDGKSIIQEFQFDDAKKNFIIEKKNLFNGINTLRVVDAELNLLCERLLYSDSIKLGTNRAISLSRKSADENQINLVGLNSLQESSISISALPEKTKANNKTGINVGLNINPYLIHPLENASYYFKDADRIKKLELDLFLVNQPELKYNWNTIKTNIPKPNYSFDIGLSIKGKIDEKIKNKTEHKVKLLSHTAFISLVSDVNETGEYFIDKFAVADSSYLDLSLLKLPDFKKVDTKLFPQIFNRSKPFKKPFKMKMEAECATSEYENTSDDYPKLSSETIRLEDVIVENKSRRPKLKFANEFGNINLRGFKIDSTYTMPLIHFISSQGFIVTRNRGQISITSQRNNLTSFNAAQSTVEITINERRLFTFDELDYMQMSEIDEIFLNRHMLLPGMQNKEGLIKIYTKKNLSKGKDYNSFKFFIEKGFSKPTKYSTEKYANLSVKGFENYGAISWSPNIISNEKGSFDFELLNTQKGKFIIDIEGINNNGELIQQELILEIK